MTTYKAMKFLIENKSIEYSSATDMIYEAYIHNKIDNEEYEELHELAHRKLK